VMRNVVEAGEPEVFVELANLLRELDRKIGRASEKLTREDTKGGGWSRKKSSRKRYRIDESACENDRNLNVFTGVALCGRVSRIREANDSKKKQPRRVCNARSCSPTATVLSRGVIGNSSLDRARL